MIKFLSDLSETLYGDATSTAFTSSLAFFEDFFFCPGFVAICLPTKSDCSEIVLGKDLSGVGPSRFSPFKLLNIIYKYLSIPPQPCLVIHHALEDKARISNHFSAKKRPDSWIP